MTVNMINYKFNKYIFKKIDFVNNKTFYVYSIKICITGNMYKKYLVLLLYVIIIYRVMFEEKSLFI